MTYGIATPASADVNRLRALCVELRDWLVLAKHMADDEIRAYPTPIPRCDAQFNYVYEQRARLAQWLSRANSVVEGSSSREVVTVLAEFVASPPLAAGTDELRLRERLRAQLASYVPASESSER